MFPSLRIYALKAASVSLLLALAACSGYGETSNGQADGKSLGCPRAAGQIAIDGRVEDAWRAADTMRLDDPADVADPNGVKIYTLWDEKYLYVAYEVADKYLVGHQYERDHKALYKDDMIEVLIDPRLDRTDEWLEDDIVYHVNILGQVKDDRGTPEGRSDATWNSEALFAVSFDGTLNDSSDTDRGFCVELAVPWQEIGKSPAEGVRLGINFAAGDAEGPDEHLWDWCGASPFRQPSVYGTLVLSD
ncbi:MAG: hypothetical protein FVQ81_14035 [Candidatus Glassbacteria bacterium]|nr:hypothetical protein [Candidatus Glassbacteria bacterium]